MMRKPEWMDEDFLRSLMIGDWIKLKLLNALTVEGFNALCLDDMKDA